MLAIFLHQLHDNLLSLRFQVSLGVLLLFFVGNGLIYTMKIERQTEEMARIDSDNEQRYQNVETLNQGADNWYKLQNRAVGTEFIAEAGFNWFEDGLWVTPRSGNTTWFTNVRTTNNWMRRFEVVDWTLIVRYVLSFLCIVLAYNAFSGELESGTLRLVLANPLSRGRFLVGKFTGHLVTLLAATLLGSLVSLLILMFNGVVELNGPLWRAYLFFLLSSGFFIALFLLLSMGISVLARSSASSLVLLVIAWTVLIIIIPQTSYLVATQAIESTDKFWDEIDTHQEQVQTALEREGIAPRAQELAQTDNYALEKRYRQRLMDMEKEMDRLRKHAVQHERDQYKLAKQVNLLSPGFAYQYAIEALLGAGVQTIENFERLGWRYRDELRTFFRSRDAADTQSPHILYLRDYMSSQKLDPADIPRFKGSKVPLADSITNGLIPLFVLVLESLLAFFFALWTFNRAEIVA